jgi:hypothetical protein
MKNLLYAILLFTGICIAMSACSNGDYTANPSSNGNNSVNPLNPLNKSQFDTWTGTGMVSAKIDGALWVADTATYTLDTSGTNVIIAYKDSFRQVLTFYFKNTWAGNIYNMGYKQYSTSANWFPKFSVLFDTFSANPKYFYTSALGNSGEMYQIENDSAFFKGKFYFQAVNGSGDIVNFTEGWFDLPKM